MEVCRTAKRWAGGPFWRISLRQEGRRYGGILRDTSSLTSVYTPITLGGPSTRGSIAGNFMKHRFAGDITRVLPGIFMPFRFSFLVGEAAGLQRAPPELVVHER